MKTTEKYVCIGIEQHYIFSVLHRESYTFVNNSEFRWELLQQYMWYLSANIIPYTNVILLCVYKLQEALI